MNGMKVAGTPAAVVAAVNNAAEWMPQGIRDAVAKAADNVKPGDEANGLFVEVADRGFGMAGAKVVIEPVRLVTEVGK